MRIESVQLKHFKSYKDTTVTLQSGLNIICGRNGSGKSNFFWAIRFVLNEAYSNLQKQQRQSLIKDGETFAFVQIQFNNSDRRFPTDNDTMILRRTISLKRDEVTLDAKSITKIQLSNILEAAGLSTSNSYYIVPQGKITSLCHSKPSELLDILKSVAGTSTYEDKRNESQLILQDTINKQSLINNSLQLLNTRLNELQIEQQQLQQYVQAQDNHKSISYNLYQLQLENNQSDISTIESNLQILHAQIDTINTNKHQLQSNTTLYISQINHNTSATLQLQANIDAMSIRISQLESALLNLNYTLTHHSNSPNTTLLVNTLNSLLSQYATLNTKYQIHSKSPISQFENHQEALAFVDQHITKYATLLDQANNHLQFLQSQLSNQLLKQQQHNELTVQYDQLSTNKRQLLLKIHQLDAQLSQLQSQSTTPNQTVTNANTISHDLDIPYHGPLSQLFQCDPSLYTIIDVVVPHLMHHIIVQSEQHAEQLLLEFKRRKYGRCTCIVLDIQHKISNTNTHPIDAEHQERLSELISCDPKYQILINNIMGNILVIDSIEHTNTHYDCVLLNGTRIEVRGGMSGGTVKPVYGALVALASINNDINKIQKNKASVQTELDVLDTQLRKLQMTLRNTTTTNIQDLNNKILEQQDTIKGLQDNITSYNELRTTTPVNLRQLKSEMTKLQNEINTLKMELEGVGELDEDVIDIDTVQHTKEMTEIELGQVQGELENAHLQLGELEVGLVTLKVKMEENSMQQSTLTTTQYSQMQEMEGLQKQLNLLINDKNGLIEAINGLGVLPSKQLIHKYANKTELQLLRLLKQKQPTTGIINKRANEQYNQYNNEYNELVERQEVLEGNGIRINELMGEMDDKQMDAMNLTFEMVQREYIRIFNEIVVEGSTELQLSENGVEITAQFDNKHEKRGLGQLSGGQKTVIALCFIFAIQSVDKQPFYVFDEIDASLDGEYRDKLAKMVKENSSDSQFIITTFKSEMIRVADVVYGVEHMNRVSDIGEIERGQALDFVDQVER